jgi:hypothetical protein
VRDDPSKHRDLTVPHHYNLRQVARPDYAAKRVRAKPVKPDPIDLEFYEDCKLNPPPALLRGHPTATGKHPMQYLHDHCMETGFHLVNGDWSEQVMVAIDRLYYRGVATIEDGRGGAVHAFNSTVREVFTSTDIRDEFAPMVDHPQCPARSPQDDEVSYVEIAGNEGDYAAMHLISRHVQDTLGISVPPVEMELVVTPAGTAPGRQHLDCLGRSLQVVIKCAPRGADGEVDVDFRGTSNSTDAFFYPSKWNASPQDAAKEMYEAATTCTRIAVGSTVNDILAFDGRHWHAAPGNPRKFDPAAPGKGSRSVVFMSFETPHKFFSDTCVIFADEFINAFKHHHL